MAYLHAHMCVHVGPEGVLGHPVTRNLQYESVRRNGIAKLRDQFGEVVLRSLREPGDQHDVLVEGRLVEDAREPRGCGDGAQEWRDERVVLRAELRARLLAKVEGESMWRHVRRVRAE